MKNAIQSLLTLIIVCLYTSYSYVPKAKSSIHPLRILRMKNSDDQIGVIIVDHGSRKEEANNNLIQAR